MVANPSDWGVDLAAYLRFEKEAAERHELIEGEIVALAGATLTGSFSIRLADIADDRGRPRTRRRWRKPCVSLRSAAQRERPHI